MKKLFLIFIAIVASSFVFAQSGQKKEKKVTWHFEVGYPFSSGSNNIRPNWDLGYLEILGYKVIEPLNPLSESWMSGRIKEFGFQSAPYPNDYTHFLFTERVQREEFLSHFEDGDRKVYNGFSKTSYKTLIPQINVGVDYKLNKLIKNYYSRWIYLVA